MRSASILLTMASTVSAATPYMGGSYPIELTVSDGEGFSISGRGIFNSLENIAEDSWKARTNNGVRLQSLLDDWFYEFSITGFPSGDRSATFAQIDRTLIRRFGGVPEGGIAERIRVIGETVELPPDDFQLTPINERQAEFRLPFEWQFDMPSDLRTFTYTLRGDATVIVSRFLIPEPSTVFLSCSALLFTMCASRMISSRRICKRVC